MQSDNKRYHRLRLTGIAAAVGIGCLAILPAAGGCRPQASTTTTTAQPQHIVRRPPLVLDTTGRDSLPQRSLEDEMFSPSVLIIHYDTTVGKDTLMQAVQDYGATVVYDYRIINAIAIRIPDGTDIHDAIIHFNAVKGVLQVSRDRRVQLMKH